MSALLAGCGNNTDLPAPKTETIATLHVAPAEEWPGGTMPTAAAEGASRAGFKSR
jgi:hypothetical protein